MDINSSGTGGLEDGNMKMINNDESEVGDDNMGLNASGIGTNELRNSSEP